MLDTVTSANVRKSPFVQDECGAASIAAQPGTALLARPDTHPVAQGQSGAGREMSLDWYVARHKSWDGLNAVERVRAAGHQCVLPRQAVRQAYRDEVIRPVFVGYLFVRLDPTRGWSHLFEPPIGLYSLIMRADRSPAPLPEGFVEQFMAEADSDGVFPWHWPEPRPGPASSQPSRLGKQHAVETGPWSGFIGRCTSDNRNKVALLLDLFGRQTTVEFRAEQLREVE